MENFKGLGAKLALLAGVPLVGLFILAVVSYMGVQDLAKVITNLNEKRIPITQLIGEVRIHSNAVGRLMWQNLSLEDAEKAKEVNARMVDRFSKVDEALAKLDTIGLVPENQKNLEAVKNLWLPLKKEYESIVRDRAVASVVDLRAKMSQTIPAANNMTDLLLHMGEVMSEANQQARAAADQTAANIRLLTVVLGVSFGVIALLISVALNYRLRRTFNLITENLSQAEQNLSAASTELSRASHSLSTASVEGAASLEETVASLEEINSQVTQNSERAQAAQSLSQAVRTSSKLGEERLSELLESIHEIEQSSRKIQDIIGIIDDISFQTNLLALNAAVEAARAGDHGKGFAVVAEAVRALSQRSAASAREINQLISESADKTSHGVQLASSSHQAIEEVFLNIEKLSTLNSEIAAASAEQATGLQQISVATSQLDTTTQSNAAAAEETSGTAEELTAQSLELHKLVGKLVEVVSGSSERKAV